MGVMGGSAVSLGTWACCSFLCQSRNGDVFRLVAFVECHLHKETRAVVDSFSISPPFPHQTASPSPREVPSVWDLGRHCPCRFQSGFLIPQRSRPCASIPSSVQPLSISMPSPCLSGTQLFIGSYSDSFPFCVLCVHPIPYIVF